MWAIPLRVWLALGLFGALAYSHVYAYRQGVESERDKQTVAAAKALAAQIAKTKAAEQATELAKAELVAYQARRQQEIEGQSHDTRERIKTIYRDRPVHAECARPDSVRDELQGAIARANAAARGL